jgi:starch synthase
VYDDDFEDALSKDLANKIKLEGITNKDLKHYKTPNYVNMIKAAIDFSDAVIIGSPKINNEIHRYIKESEKPFIEFQPMDQYIDVYSDFYDEILVNETVTVD